MNATAANLNETWFQLVPLGEHPHTGISGESKVQVVDPAAVRAMANGFRPKVLIDQEHWSYDMDKSSEAQGWLVEVEPRADGLYGRIEWTDIGAQAVANSRYRFLSPVWLSRDLEKLGGNRVRPLRIDSLGLTNTPNIKAIEPLMNRLCGGAAPITQRQPRPQLIANRAVPVVLRNRGVLKFTDVVNDLKRVTGQSFEALFQTFQPLLNRFANPHGAVDANSLWNEALTLEQEAFDKSYDILVQGENYDRGHQLYKSVVQPRGEFIKAVEDAMRQKGLTFEQAWDFLKETEPAFFLRHVLTIGTNGRVG